MLKINKKIKILIILLLLILLPIYIFSIIDNFYSEQTTKYINTEVKNNLSNYITNIINEQLKYQNLELVEYIYDNNQNINNISLNSYNINQLISISSNTIQTLIDENKIEKSLSNIEFPLGQMLGLTLLASTGPKIYIDTTIITDYKIDLQTELIEYGINNLMFSAYLLVNLNAQVIIPLRNTPVNFQTKIYLINEILQGNIPDVYFKG